MDLWGNVKIPILQNHAADDWEAVPDVAETVQYSSLAGIPTNYKTRGNASFSLESSYIDLSCYNFTRVEGPSFIAFQVMDYEEVRDAAETGGNPSQTFVSAPKNGSWHGYKWNRDDANYTDSNGEICTRGQSSTLAMALDRFVDPIWFNTTSQRRMAKGKAEDDDSVTTWGSPALLKNESGIDAGMTRLLLQLSFPGLVGVNRPSDRMEVTCNVTQRYVESRVVCHESADQRSCRVVEQRPSQKQHASEQVSHLSFPRTFNYISKDVPLITSNALSVYYLQDPNFANISQSGKPVATLKSIEDESIGVRLSQLLNTYLALGQLSFRIASGSLEKDTVFEPNITVLEDTVTAVEKYEVSITWMGLCLLSSVVMLVAGACSVWFTHLAYGPEILGYVSTAIRNSKLVDVPPHTVWLDGPALTKEITGKRVKYGFVPSAEPSPVVVGIGPEEKTQSMESFLDQEKGA